MQIHNSSQGSDLDLVDRTLQGDLAAFGCLYDRYINQIYRYVYFRVANQVEAEDLTQIIFLKTFQLIRKRTAKIDNFKKLAVSYSSQPGD